MFGGTYTFKVKELDLDDQVFVMGFAKFTIDEAVDWRRLNPIDNSLISPDFNTAVGDMKNGRFY